MNRCEKAKTVWQLMAVAGACLLLGGSKAYSDTVAGTAPRLEEERKLTFSLDDSDSLADIISNVHKRVGELVSKLAFPERASCLASVDSSPVSFMFVDHYFDTKDFDLMRGKGAYRFRRRWSKSLSYVRNQLYRRFNLFPPTRMEIQAKLGYERVGLRGLRVHETRFEFRKESSPFSDGVKLPPADWAVTDYENVVTSGKYEAFKIYPFKMLEERGIDVTSLKRVMSIATERTRFHLNCKHPFGSGPNPEQMFIFTVDKSTCLEGCDKDLENTVELEIEKERNTSTYLDMVSAFPKGGFFSNSLVADLAIDYAIELKSAYRQDYDMLGAEIERVLRERKIEVGPVMSKYQRFLKKSL